MSGAEDARCKAEAEVKAEGKPMNPKADAQTAPDEGQKEEVEAKGKAKEQPQANPETATEAAPDEGQTEKVEAEVKAEEAQEVQAVARYAKEWFKNQDQDQAVARWMREMEDQADALWMSLSVEDHHADAATPGVEAGEGEDSDWHLPPQSEAEEAKAAEAAKAAEEAKAAKAVEEVKAAEEAKAAESAKAAQEAKAAEVAKAAEEAKAAKAAEEAKATECSKAAEEAQAAEAAKAAEEAAKAVAEAKAAEAAKAAEEAKAAEAAKVAEEAKTAETAKAAEEAKAAEAAKAAEEAEAAEAPKVAEEAKDAETAKVRMTSSTQDLPLEKRKAEAKRILEKHPDRIPVICSRHPSAKETLPELDKKKFLVPSTMLVGEFKYIVHKQVAEKLWQQVGSDVTIYMFVEGNNIQPKTGTRMSEVYENFKADDGFVYLTYTAEATLGCASQEMKRGASED